MKEMAEAGRASEEILRLRDWLAKDALAFWATKGFDREAGSFHERLDFSGDPIVDAPRRLMAQCRQIYVFSHATLLGWFDGRDLARGALRALLLNYRVGQGEARYVFSVSRSGDVVDARADTYSYAFLLFALSWARRLLGEAEVKSALAGDLLDYLLSRLAHPAAGGFVCGEPRSDNFLRQNPQMHLFEALLEADDAFSLPRARDAAESIFRLFNEKILQHDALAIPELCGDDWRPVHEPEGVFEPGHHFEWIWLLDRYGARFGVDVETVIAALAERSYREGLDVSGAAIDSVGIKTGRRVASLRCWGTCEGLKAACADFAAGRNPALAADRAANFAHALRTIFLGRPFAEGWIDRVDERGAPAVDFVPASTLYHIMLATAEATRAFALT